MLADAAHARSPATAPFDREAASLAALLRRARLTVVRAESPVEASELLGARLAAELDRVEKDAAPPAADGGRLRTPASLVDIVVLFDGQNEPSVAALLGDVRDAMAARLGRAREAAGGRADEGTAERTEPDLAAPPADAVLAEQLAAWSAAHRARFLVLLDRFEACLERLPTHRDARLLVEELVVAINRPGLPANFLIAVSGPGQALFDPIAQRFDLDFFDVDPPGSPSTGASGRLAGEAHDGFGALTTRDVYESIEARLLESAGISDRAAWQDSLLQLPHEPAAAPANDDPKPSVASRPKKAFKGRLAGGVVALTLLALIAIAWISPPPASRTAMPLGVAPGAPERVIETLARRSVPAAAPIDARAGWPRFDVVSDAEDTAGSRIADELARAVGPGARVDVRRLTLRTSDEVLASLDKGAGVAIVRYDALQRSRRQSSGARLEIVAPLYTQDIGFIVAADSPLTAIHEIDALRINVGPPNGSRARTLGAVYERMFAKPLPAEQIDALEEGLALRRLLAGRDVDVIGVVGASAWLAALPAELAASLKLLAVDRRDRRDREALEVFLPASARLPGGPPTPTLAVMSFLVTGATPNAGAPTGNDAIDRIFRELCKELPSLRHEASAEWREIDVARQLPTGLDIAYSKRAETAFAACSANAARSPKPLVGTS